VKLPHPEIIGKMFFTAYFFAGAGQKNQKAAESRYFY